MQKLFNVQDLKKQVSAQQVVSKYLGVPKNVTGKASFWDTPFRDNIISRATLKVTEDYIVDLGGDFKGDIIYFMCKLKHIKPYEAIQMIAKDFNVQGLSEYIGDDEVKVKKESKKVEKIVLDKVEQEAKEIWTMLDIIDFKKKPTEDEIGAIKERIPSLKVASYDLNTLCQKLTSGHTCIPAGIVGNSDKNWKSQQVFMIDIDNVIKVGRKMQKILEGDSRHVTLEKVVEYCGMMGLSPTAIYQTFSYTDKCNKFRLVYVMQEPVTDIDIAKNIYLYLVEQLRPLNIDEAPTNLASIFFGGKTLCECTGICYKPVKKEIDVEKTSYEVVQDYGDYNNIIKELENYGYGVRQGYLCKISYNNYSGLGEEHITPIANFLPIITKQETYTNGKDEITNYGVKALLLPQRKELTEIIVTKEELESVKYATNPEWNIQAIKEPIMRVEDSIRYVTQLVSKNDIECKKVYAHTGFIRIDGKLVYLCNGMVIGDVQNLDVDLSLDGLEQYTFTDKEFDIKEALKTSYSILDVAEYKITIPLIAVTYLAPLTTLFSKRGMLADFVVWVQGPTGSRKTSVVAVVLSHYGTFRRNNLPCSFRDTANSLEKKAYVLKDCINVVDDFNPETVGTGKTGTAEKIFGMYGDRAGRDRMSKNGKTLNGAYYPRGLCIMTGESFPKVAESRIARTIIVNMNKKSINLQKLKVLQENTEKLSYSMKCYINWIIENEELIIKKALKMQEEMQEKEIQGELHGRTLEAVNMLTIGFALFLDFLCEKDVITQKEKQEKLNECKTILEEMAQQQKESIDENKPTELFAEAITEILVSGKAQVMNYNIPCDPKLCPNLIGFYDDCEGQYYILPDVAYAMIVRFYRAQGIKFPVSKASLQKMLAEEGYLYIPPKSDRKTVKRKVPSTNSTVTVWAIYQEKFGKEPFTEVVKEYDLAYKELKDYIKS